MIIQAQVEGQVNRVRLVKLIFETFIEWYCHAELRAMGGTYWSHEKMPNTWTF